MSAGLAAGLVSPVWAAPAGDGGEGRGGVELGSFSLGDGLEGAVGELDGSFGFGLPAGGVHVAWDSRRAGMDVAGLGAGWSFGLTTVRVTGGVWVFPASGGAYEMDLSVPSGLAGYPGTDVRFEAAVPGSVVPARADGSVGETAYAYVLHELGGVSTYFDAAGFPVVRVVLGGERLDWAWEGGGSGRLVSVVSPDGSVSELDWSDPARVVIVPGSTVVDPVAGSGVGGRWVVELDGGRVSALVDPVGGRTEVSYDRHGLVERVADPAGAVTVVQWQGSSDGVARVSRVRVLDAVTGAEVSAREWGADGVVSATAWALIAESPVRGGAVGSGFETWVSDGKTSVRFEVDAHGRLTERAVEVTSSAGARVVQEQSLEYPEVGGPVGRPGEGMQATAASTIYYDAGGASRVATESYERDEFGRMVSRTAVDGSVVRRVYDEVVPVGRALPVGLVVEETTTAADGLVSSTRSELSADRSAVAAAESWSGRAGEELVRTERVESDVVDGFVTEQREFPGGDPAATPVVTRWSKQVDLARGTRTVVQTDAAGTAVEFTTESVSSLVHGGVLSETDAVGNVTSARYDDAARQLAVEDATGASVGYAYRTRQADGLNAVLTTDVTGVTVTEVRDVLGRVVRKTDDIGPSGRVVPGFERVIETREYAPGMERLTDAWGAVTQTEQDVFGRDERVRLPSGLVQVAEFDDVAGTATSGVSLTNDLADAVLTSTKTLDSSGRVTATTGVRADGVEVPETATEYDGFGRDVQISDGSLSTSIEYDAFGNQVATELASVLDPQGADAEAGMTAEREFDGFGVSVEKTLRSETETAPGQRRELDVLGRVVVQTDQRGTAERTTYTPDGLVAELRSDTGRVITGEYHPVSRLLVATRVSSPTGAMVATGFRYDEADRLVAVFDPADEAGTTIGYEHDDFGNVTRTVYPDGAEIRHEYDPHGRKTATIDVDGNRTEYTYDPGDGAMVAAVQTDRDGKPVSGVRYSYDEYRRVNLIERDNGVRTEVVFTSAAEIASEVTTGPDGVLSEREYEYTPGGNLASRIDRVRGEGGELEATRTDYEYDAFDRLIGSSVREGEAVVGRVLSRSEYVPTIGGDLASETVMTDPDTEGAVTVTRRFEYSAIGELVAITTDGGERHTQSFDAGGSLTASALGDRYEYDAAGRQIAHTTPDGVKVATEYWADGARKAHSTETGSTRYYWDGVRLLNEAHESPGAERGRASYLVGTSRHARIIRPDGGGPVVSYYGTDRHGNVTDLTDQTGAITTGYSYTDYGVATVTGDRSDPLPAGIGELGYNPFQYAGEYTHRDGTQLLGPRIYDPPQARFTTRDAAPLANLYAFVDLNPITNVDPSGRWSQADTTNAALTTVGYLVALAGAAAMLLTGGVVFSALGVIGVAISGGEFVLTAVTIADALSEDDFTDPEAVNIASGIFFATSLMVGLGGFVGQLAKRGTTKAAKACMRLMDFACMSDAEEVAPKVAAGTRNHFGAAVRGQLAADDLYARQQAIRGWKLSLKKAKVEHLPTFEDDHFLDATLTAHMRTAKDALQDAKATAIEASGSSFHFTTARESFDHLIAAESKIKTLVELADKQLGYAQTRLREIAPGSALANTAFGQIDDLRYELAFLLGKERQVVTLRY